MQFSLQLLIGIVAGFITTAGVVAIIVSIVRVGLDYWHGLRGIQPYPTFRNTRLTVGQGLVLALEFFVGADLLRTVLQPFPQHTLFPHLEYGRARKIIEFGRQSARMECPT